MKSKYMTRSLCAFALLVPTSSFGDGLFAQGAWVAGAFVGYSRGLYEGDDTEFGAVPFLSYSTGRFSIGFDGITYRAVQTDALDFALTLSPGSAPDFPDDNPLYAGLDRGTAIDAGIKATYAFEGFYLAGSARHDMSSEHSGYQIETRIGTNTNLRRVALDGSVGARFRDGKLSNHMVGVSAAEANADRAAYDAGSTVEPFVSLSFTMPISEKTALTGGFEVSLLGGGLRDSPLVGAKTTQSFMVGLIHRF